MAGSSGGENPRRYLIAYLRAQDLHKQIHKLTKSFESDATDREIWRQLDESQDLFNQIKELLQS